MGLVEALNRCLGKHSLQVVSPGQAVKAMILNGLGFVIPQCLPQPAECGLEHGY